MREKKERKIITKIAAMTTGSAQTPLRPTSDVVLQSDMLPQIVYIGMSPEFVATIVKSKYVTTDSCEFH